MAVQVISLVNYAITLTDPAYILKPFENRIFTAISVITSDLAAKDSLKLLQAEVIIQANLDDGGGQALVTAENAAAAKALSGASISVGASRNITAADNGLTLLPTGALTLTIPAGLSPMPSFTVDCPASGIVSIAVSGGATINGATATLTRTRASNPVGFVILAHAETGSYGVSGA